MKKINLKKIFQADESSSFLKNHGTSKKAQDIKQLSEQKIVNCQKFWFT